MGNGAVNEAKISKFGSEGSPDISKTVGSREAEVNKREWVKNLTVSSQREKQSGMEGGETVGRQ